MNNQQQPKDLINFIAKSPSVFHVINNTIEILRKHNYTELGLDTRWELKRGCKYFVTINNSALIAFVIGKERLDKIGFRLIGAHTDSPGFRVKSNPEIVVEGRYLKLNCEVYGSPIYNTWFDRPLSLAGRVSCKTEDPFLPETKLINIDKPLMIIPNLAIHINRKVNDGEKLNEQLDLLPLLSNVSEEFKKDNFLINLIAEKLAIDPDKILDFDLFLYDYQPGEIIGLNNEFISAPKLDDLAMIHAGLMALIASSSGQATNVLALYDNEEVGSRTPQGADSPVLANVLERIALNLGLSRLDYLRTLDSSYMVSADMAHALHPNKPEKNDPTNKVIINHGPVIKVNAKQSYLSNSDTIAIFKEICDRAAVSPQIFYNRSDERGGSTIGPIASTQLGIKTVDIGNPLLAMHSIREVTGVKDQLDIRKVFQKYYSL